MRTIKFLGLATIFAAIACFADGLTDDKKALQKAAASAEVTQELDGPDGATMQLTSEGGWRIFSIGRGTYDFDDNDDIQQARQEAMLQAKAHISKFMSETVSSDETLGRLSEKKKKLSSSGDGAVEKSDVKTMTTMIKSQSKNLLSGVIALETAQTPNPKGNGGTFVVKLGISNKTVSTAGQVKAGIEAANSPAASAEVGSGTEKGRGPSDPGNAGNQGLNRSKTEKSKTDF